MEVFTQSMHQVVWSEMQGHGLEIIDQLVWFWVQIVIFQSRIVLDRLVSASDIKAKSWRRTIMVVVHVGEQISFIVLCILSWPPNHLHPLVLESKALVLVVNSSEEKRLHAHPAEHRGWRGLMSKRVDMPSDRWYATECFLEPSVTDSHLINYIFVIRSGLIRHAPAPIDKLDLAVLVKLLHLVSLCLCGLVPPSV